MIDTIHSAKNLSCVVAVVFAVATGGAIGDSCPIQDKDVGTGASPALTREVPVTDVPPEFRNNLEILGKRYANRLRGNGNGRLVFGRLDVEDGSLDDIATWAWLDKNGMFTAAAIMAARQGLVFLKHGYEPLVVSLCDAHKPWRNDVALDLDTVVLKKLAQEKTATFSLTAHLPKGVEEGTFFLMLQNNSPCGYDWGTCGKEKPSCTVASISFRDGERITVPGCSPVEYSFVLVAPDCPKYTSPSKKLAVGGNDFGEISMMRIKTASFATRPFGEKGGKWVRRTVDVDGQTPLLLFDGTDDCGNSCMLHLDAYGDSGRSIVSHFGWGNTICEDLGEMKIEEFEHREESGAVPQPDGKKPDFKLVPGHLYRLKNDWHWKIDLLIAFESYQDAPQRAVSPVPKANGDVVANKEPKAEPKAKSDPRYLALLGLMHATPQDFQKSIDFIKGNLGEPYGLSWWDVHRTAITQDDIDAFSENVATVLASKTTAKAAAALKDIEALSDKVHKDCQKDNASDSWKLALLLALSKDVESVSVASAFLKRAEKKRIQALSDIDKCKDTFGWDSVYEAKSCRAMAFVNAYIVGLGLSDMPELSLLLDTQSYLSGEDNVKSSGKQCITLANASINIILAVDEIVSLKSANKAKAVLTALDRAVKSKISAQLPRSRSSRSDSAEELAILTADCYEEYVALLEYVKEKSDIPAVKAVVDAKAEEAKRTAEKARAKASRLQSHD